MPPIFFSPVLASIAGYFTWADWSVVLGYLVVTTVIGGLLAGKQATIRDFFLGGRKLPWYAVTGSTIATEISAVTFVGVPAIVFASRGNFTYLQLVIGSILARIIVGYVFVPAYYKREIYSPYDYMANELGGHVRTMTTCLFTLSGMLAQGARVYLTAVILDLIIGESFFGRLADATGTGTMTWSIFAIGVVAVGWTLMGGIAVVIWTDVLLFLVFFVGGFLALGFALWGLPGTWAESITYMFRVGAEVDEAGPWGKFTVFDFSLSPAAEFTIWTAIFANTWFCLFAYGTDQLLAQRMFCCKNESDARRAIIASSFGQVITLVMLFVGVGLFAYYTRFPLTGEAAELVAARGDRIFPIFIITVLPVGITGLLIAGIFAAAISSLDSILAALSQTSISAFYLPWRKWRLASRGQSVESDPYEDRTTVRVSRVFVVFWGVVLCGMAHVADAAARSQFPEILNLALSMAGYAGGALLAGFLLAFLRLGIDGRGFLWSGPLSVLLIFALVWHQPWAQAVCWVGGAILLITWLGQLWSSTSPTVSAERQRPGVLPAWAQTLVLMAGVALVLWVSAYGYFDKSVAPDGAVRYTTVAWPWFVPIGSTVAFVWGWLLARRRTDADAP
jgi:solute:Na+ symporter, SSS family